MCVGVGVRASAHTLSGLWDSQGSPDHFSPLGVGVGRPGPSPDPSPFSLKGWVGSGDGIKSAGDSNIINYIKNSN